MQKVAEKLRLALIYLIRADKYAVPNEIVESHLGRLFSKNNILLFFMVGSRLVVITYDFLLDRFYDIAAGLGWKRIE